MSEQNQAKDLIESELDQSEPILLSFKPIEPELELPRMRHVCIHDRIASQISNQEFSTNDKEDVKDINSKLNQLQISNDHQQNN